MRELLMVNTSVMSKRSHYNNAAMKIQVNDY